MSSEFPHRHNKDGSYDSICTTCLATVASVEKESQLAPLEATHVCDPVNLYRTSQGCTRAHEARVAISA